MASKTGVVTAFILGFMLAVLAVRAPLVEHLAGVTPGAPGATSTSVVTVTTTLVKEAPPSTVTVTSVYTHTHVVTETLWYTTTRTVTATVTIVKSITRVLVETVTKTLTKTVTVTVTQPLLGAHPQLPRYIQPPRLDNLRVIYRGLRVEVLLANGHVIAFVVENPRGFLEGCSIQVTGNDSTILSIGFGEGDVMPILAYYDGSMALVAIDASKLLSRLGPGVYSFEVYPNGSRVECRVALSRDSIRVLGCEASLCTIIRVSGAGYESIGDALARAINESVVDTVAKAVWGRRPSPGPSVVWSLAAWEEENISYDYVKAGNPFIGVYSPLTLLRERRGVCSDYAVFTAAALAAANMPALVLVFPRLNHATAATVLSGGVYVIDQRLPVATLQDYLEYVAHTSNETVVVYLLVRVGPKGSAVIAYPVSLSTRTVPDDYPEDKLPARLEEEVSERVAAKASASAYPGLRTVASWMGVGRWICYAAPVLGGIGGGRAPLGALYSPVFRDQWVEYLASLAPQPGTGGMLWVMFERREGMTCLHLYQVPVEVHASIYRSSGVIIVEVLSDAVRGVNDVQLLLYPRGYTKPCAGIAPPGWRYQGIPYINAETWRIAQGRATIAIDEDKLVELAESACGKPAGLAVLVKSNAVYVWKVG